MLSLLADAGSSMFFPSQSSTIASEVDWVFDFIYYLSVFFFVLVVAVMSYFVLKYYRRPGHTEEPSASHNEWLEITWSVIPSILVGVIFFYGFTGYLDMREAPEGAYEIQVVGSRWKWDFYYPDGTNTVNELHMPVNRPVRFLINSAKGDVLHSFFIPAFRIKMDSVPERFTTTWAEATHVTGHGINNEDHEPLDLFCAEYCGQQHSRMIGKVYIHEPAEFEAWLAKAGDLFADRTPLEVGEYIFKQRCQQCHSTDGSRKTGPSFQGSWGTERTVTPRGGSPQTIVFDEEYVRESIREPNAKIAGGYSPGMPPFDSRMIDDRELAALITFLKSLN